MKRTMLVLLMVEEDEPRPFDTDGCEVEELSAIVKAKPFLAKCGELVQDDARRRKAGGR